jgi:MFS family permease
MIDFIGGFAIGGIGGGVGIFCLLSMVTDTNRPIVGKRPWLGWLFVFRGLAGFCVSILIPTWFVGNYIEQHFSTELVVPRLSLPSRFIPTLGTTFGVIAGLCLCAPFVFILTSWIVDLIFHPREAWRDLRSKLQQRKAAVNEVGTDSANNTSATGRRRRGKRRQTPQ